MLAKLTREIALAGREALTLAAYAVMIWAVYMFAAAAVVAILWLGG